MLVKRLSEDQRRKIIEEISNSISNFLDVLVKENKVRTYELSIKLSDDWPYTLEIDLSVSVNPFWSDKKEEITKEAMDLGFKKAREIFSKIGLSEL